ncbi:lipopolysaccharide assembly protein LapA domain-containing protein [Thioalkalivibrio sp. ALMg13-2]|uniref:lipopolysaccharide assembly protein LapA domain-containing protein n=1 Tax=Thioalkalivibrio sp. ALMg13-2 TaxID=1158167 RepID=UPI000369C94D|nr:lipopolysaccharide assembly protein LapA domain-containing protein [Thioalkalivibrio sp. ALMg13-2]
MRYLYTLLIIVFVAVVAIFAIQNLRLVTLNFLTLYVTLPLALLIVGIYLLGLISGGALFALLKRWIRGASR